MYTKWQLTRGQRGEGEVSDAARAEKERIGKLPVELSGNRGLHLPLTTALTHLTPLYHSRHDRRGRRAGRPSDRSREGRERKEVRLGRCGANQPTTSTAGCGAPSLPAAVADAAYASLAPQRLRRTSLRSRPSLLWSPGLPARRLRRSCRGGGGVGG